MYMYIINYPQSSHYRGGGVYTAVWCRVPSLLVDAVYTAARNLYIAGRYHRHCLTLPNTVCCPFKERQHFTSIHNYAFPCHLRHILPCDVTNKRLSICFDSVSRQTVSGEVDLEDAWSVERDALPAARGSARRLYDQTRQGSRRRLDIR